MNVPQDSTANAIPNEPAPDVVEQAANWHVELHSAEATDGDFAAFEQWRNQHPAHAEAYRRLESLWGRFNGLDTKPVLAVLESVLQPGSAYPKRKKLPVTAIVSALLIMTAGWIAVQTGQTAYFLAEYRTPVGGRQVIELVDHSRITLNTHSAIDVDYSDNQRRITLHQGEILVEVAKNPAQLFIVETPQGTARALGTKYVVKREHDATTVSVIESVVEACAAHAWRDNTQTACLHLQAGEAVRITVDALQQPSQIDIQSVAAWSDGMLSVDNRPLGEVLTELERYRPGRIYFNASAIQHLRVSGVFPLNDTDRSLAVLAGTLPIRISRYTPLLVIVRSR